MDDPKELIRVSDEFETRKYEARIGLYKIVFGTGLVGLVAALTPAILEAWQNYTKSIADYRTFVSSYVEEGASQDIGLRIRIAEYFSKVSASEDDQTLWGNYLTTLEDKRDKGRDTINKLERDIAELLASHYEDSGVEQGEDPPPLGYEDQIKLQELRRNLRWAYGDIGRIEPGQSIVPSGQAEDAETAPRTYSSVADWPDFSAFSEFIGSLELKHFSPSEFLVMGNQHSNPDSPCAGLNSFPPRELWPNIIATARAVDRLADTVGVPVTINAGYRTPAYNACIGSSSVSQHLRFSAVDIRSPRMTPEELASAVAELRSDGAFLGGIGRYNAFVHVDTRGVNATWPSAFEDSLDVASAEGSEDETRYD